MKNTINKTKTLFKKAYHYNWDNGVNGLIKIVTDPNCDKATALLIFWHGCPDFYYNSKDKLASYELRMFDFLQNLEGNILGSAYPTIISYSPDKSLIPENLGNIPHELAKAVVGEINYLDVLFPNNNPFDEQIMELCKNCRTVKEMYELEKAGANFGLKVNRGYSYPIQIAISFGQTEALRYFVENKYDINKKYDKNPLFFKAVYNKDLSILKMMIENGCNINQKGEYGRTILHQVGGYYSNAPDKYDAKAEEILIYLIQNGADLNILDTDKKTALELAVRWDSKKYIDFINKIQKKTGYKKSNE